MLGKTEVGRRRGRQRIRWLDGISNLMAMSLSELWELVMAREAWHAAINGAAQSNITEWLNWTNASNRIRWPTPLSLLLLLPKVGLWEWDIYLWRHPKLFLGRTRGGNQWFKLPQSNEDKAYGYFTWFPVSGHRLGLLYIMADIPIHGGQSSSELRLQPLNPTQH